MSEQYELEEIKCIKCAEDKIVTEETVVYEINENVVGPSGENVPCEKIVTANMDNYGQRTQYYNQGGGQASYYQQQHVGAQPVYVQTYTPVPVNAAQTSRYRQGQVQRDYSGDNFMFNESFTEKAIRNKFIQRVYTILTVQLIYTCCFIALCVFEPSVKYTVLMNPLLAIISLVIFFVTYIYSFDVLYVGKKKFPNKFYFVRDINHGTVIPNGIFVCFEIYKDRNDECGYYSRSLLNYFHNCMSKFGIFDMTGCGIYLYILGNVIMLFGFIAIIVVMVTGSQVMYVVYAALIALLFSMYLMYDTQMIMGGRRIELSPEEYISGAITLYLDIIYILWSIMILLDACDN